MRVNNRVNGIDVLGTQSLKFNRSQFMDLTDACSRTGQYEAVINRSHPALLVKLDTRYIQGDSVKL